MWTRPVHFFVHAVRLGSMVNSKPDVDGPFLTPEEECEADAALQVARSLVADALAKFKPHVSDEGYALLEASLLFELMATPAGKANLARLLPAPVVDRSGEVVKASSPRRTRAKAGSDR